MADAIVFAFEKSFKRLFGFSDSTGSFDANVLLVSLSHAAIAFAITSIVLIAVARKRGFHIGSKSKQAIGGDI